MQTSPSGVRFIESNEGLRLSVYKDVAGYQTIGYGHRLVLPESFPNGVTEPQAARILSQDLSTRFEPAVNRLAPQANQNQFDALVDFCWLNLGPSGSLATHAPSRVRSVFRSTSWLGVTQRSTELSGRFPIWKYVGLKN